MALFLSLFFLANKHANSLAMQRHVLQNGARFEATQCQFSLSSIPFGYQTISWASGKIRRIECGFLSTRKEQGKSFFRLPIVIIRDSFWYNSKSPVLNISGGPGGSTWLEEEGISIFWLTFFDEADWQHDLVLFDARGTGSSQPALQCKNFYKGLVAIFTKDLQPEEEAKAENELTKHCYQVLASSDDLGALQHLGTRRSADDLADLATLFKIDSWHLYGTSYGTRLALEVARRHPKKVASLILDSVYPQEFDGEETLPALYLDSLKGIFKACAADAKCSRHYPNLNKQFNDIMQGLQKKPAILTFGNADKPIEFILTPSRFFSVLFNAGYAIDNIVVVPNAIHSLHAGSTDAIGFLVQVSLELMRDESFSDPVFMEVECNENEIKNQHIHIQNIRAKYKNYPVLKRWQLALFKESVCKPWGAKEVDNSFHLPVNSEKPALIFAGKFDSVTPTKWGKALAKHLPNSEYHEFQASAHAVLFEVDCAKTIVRRFLNPEKNYSNGCQIKDGIYKEQVLWEPPDVK